MSGANSVKHELCKSLICYLLRKYGDFKISDETVRILGLLQKEVNSVHKDWVKQSASFVTEAVPKSNKDRRDDIVRLDTNDWLEIETDKKVSKEGCYTIRV